MKYKHIIIILILLFFAFTGCKLEQVNNNFSNGLLSTEDIFKKYQDKKYNVYYYQEQKYVLVEYNVGYMEQIETYYDLYNCEKEDYDEIRPHALTTLHTFTSNFIKLEVQRHIEDVYYGIPYFIEYYRNGENKNSKEDFVLTSKTDKKFEIDDEVNFVGKIGMLTDINLSHLGIEFLFKPSPQDKDSFFAARSCIPSCSIFYDCTINAICYSFEGTVNDQLLQRIDLINNQVIEPVKAISIRTEKDIVAITIEISEEVNYFLRMKHTLDDLPILQIEWAK